jgi:hypothetical protein
MDMPILNYTTTIDAHKTLGEIQKRLTQHGARRLLLDYDEDGDPVALSFQIMVRGEPFHYRLPCRHHQVLALLAKEPRPEGTRPRKLKTESQALRVAWRILKDWIEAQLAIVEASLVELPEVFLPYAITPTGETVYEQISRQGYLLPGPRQNEEDAQ